MNYTSYYHPSSFCKFLIDDTSKFAHLYGNRLANHLPMSLVALDAMGANEAQLRSFAEYYQKRLEMREIKAIDTVVILDILGKRECFEGAVAFFLRQIHLSDISGVVSEYIDLLAPGISASAFHALIRLAYGIEIQSPDEVAIGLAYLTSEYQSVGDPIHSSSHSTIDDLMSCTRSIVGKVDVDQPGIIVDRIHQISQSTLFHPLLVVPINISIDSIANIALDVYLASRNNFTLLHGVTATHALRSILPFSRKRQRMLEYFWIAFLAAYVTTGEKYGAYASKQVMISGDEYFDIQKKIACESRDDHTIKLTYTTWKEWQRSGDSGYIAALDAHHKFPDEEI